MLNTVKKANQIEINSGVIAFTVNENRRTGASRSDTKKKKKKKNDNIIFGLSAEMRAA